MRIDSLMIRGWMAFRGEFSMTLPAGPIAIMGQHAGDTRRSNRAGKTAFLEAHTWALFGVHRKRTDDAIINREVDECCVKVTLGDLQVMRARKRGHSSKLTVHDRDVLKDENVTFTGDQAQEHIVRVLGLSVDDYLATSCFRQGDVEALINRTAGERLAIVSEWLRHDAWTEAKRLQLGKVTAHDKALAAKRAELDAAKPYCLGAAMQTALQDELKRLEVARDEKQAVHDGRLGQLKDSVICAQAIAHHAELATLRARAVELKPLLVARADLDERVKVFSDARDLASANLAKVTAAFEELKAFREKGFDGRCPVMCDACPVADGVDEKLSQRNDLYRQRQEDLLKADDFYRQACVSHDKLVAEQTKLGKLAAEYQQVVSRGKTIAAGVLLPYDQAHAGHVDPSALRDEMRKEQESLERNRARSAEVEQILAVGAKGQLRVDVITNQIEACEEESRISHLALRAIASVPSTLAAEQLTELEQDANVLLAGSGVSLRFSWQRELSDKAPVCNDCGFEYIGQRHDQCPQCRAQRGKKLAQELEILCDDGSGGEEDARYNSGGTKAVVGSAIRLAASAMLRRTRGAQAGWAVVDEPFGQLDMENREQLARTFAGMLGGVGLEQALVVSHDPLLLGALPNRIVIDKDGTASTARLE